MSDFDKDLDDAAEGKAPTPKQKTPEELAQNPLALLDPEGKTMEDFQRDLDDTWQVAEGGGTRKWGIKDNGSETKSSI